MEVALHPYTMKLSRPIYFSLRQHQNRNAMDFRKLFTRTWAGLLYCLIIVGCIFLGKWGILALGCILSVAACVEFAKITHELDEKYLPTLIIDIAGCIALCMVPIWPLCAMMWVALMIARLIEQLYVRISNPLRSLSISLMTQIYIGGPMMVMTYFGNSTIPMILLAMFFFLWINDTGAFLVGSMAGRHRLFERISPKKSWEGFFGGLFFCIGFAFLFRYCLEGLFNLEHVGADIGFWLGMAVTVSVFGTWGDLVESLIKRGLHIKDSGNLIPGHGGILDRIDSLLLVLPSIFLYYFIYSCI